MILSTLGSKEDTTVSGEKRGDAEKGRDHTNRSSWAKSSSAEAEVWMIQCSWAVRQRRKASSMSLRSWILDCRAGAAIMRRYAVADPFAWELFLTLLGACRHIGSRMRLFGRHRCRRGFGVRLPGSGTRSALGPHLNYLHFVMLNLEFQSGKDDHNSHNARGTQDMINSMNSLSLNVKYLVFPYLLARGQKGEICMPSCACLVCSPRELFL